jgi:CRISPR-associated protein Cas2
MFVLVSYDVSTRDRTGRRRLRRVAKVCEDFGQRVQFSVFECHVGEIDLTHLRQRLLQEINPAEDSLRVYILGEDPRHRVEHYGQKPSIDFEDALVV